MRLDVGPSVVWRGAVAVVAGAGVAAVMAWLLSIDRALAGWLPLVGVAAIVLSVALAASLWRIGGAELRWDGSCWWLTPRGAALPLAGGVHVAVDLGSFLLLRFAPLAGGGSRWLPVDARGVSGGWHALRCALYSARLDQAAPGLVAPSP